jgi:hypothetical protein
MPKYIECTHCGERIYLDGKTEAIAFGYKDIYCSMECFAYSVGNFIEPTEEMIEKYGFGNDIFDDDND